MFKKNLKGVRADQDAVTQIKPIKANKANKEQWIECVSVLGNEETRSPGVYSFKQLCLALVLQSGGNCSQRA